MASTVCIAVAKNACFELLHLDEINLQYLFEAYTDVNFKSPNVTNNDDVKQLKMMKASGVPSSTSRHCKFHLKIIINNHLFQ